jgi:hypothetical protein
MTLASAASDKSSIANYMVLLEDERKATLVVLSSCETAEAQKRMMEAIEDVQIRVTPTKMLSASNLLAAGENGRAPTASTTWMTEKKHKDSLVSAVCLQLPPISPGARGVKGYVGNRLNQMLGKGYKFERGERFVDGIYDPTDNHLANGIPSYVKRTDPNVFLVLNNLLGRWQIQADEDNTNPDCYAYCEKTFAHPERTAGHAWAVIQRDGSYLPYADIAITTQHSHAQLDIIDREDRRSRLISSTTKMTTVDEAASALSILAYSTENMENVALVLKVLSSILDVIRPDHLVTAADAATNPAIDGALRALAEEMCGCSIVADDTPGYEVCVPLVVLLVGDGGLLPTHLGDSPEVCYCVLKVARCLTRYGVNTCDPATTLPETVRLFAQQRGFIECLIEVVNRHVQYQHIIEQALWLIAILAPTRPKKFSALSTIAVIIHNAEDEYDQTLDHVTNSTDVAIAICETLGALTQAIGPKGAVEFDDAWGPDMFVKILKTHWRKASVCKAVCASMSQILPHKPSLYEDFDLAGAPYDLLKICQLNFWNEGVVGACLRVLHTLAGLNGSTTLLMIAKTRGALAVLIRLSECYKGNASILKSTQGLYEMFRRGQSWDIKDAEGRVCRTVDIRRELMRQVRDKRGKEYMYVWDGVYRTQYVTFEDFVASLRGG